MAAAVLSGDQEQTAAPFICHLGARNRCFPSFRVPFKSSAWTVEHFHVYTPCRVSIISVSLKSVFRAYYCLGLPKLSLSEDFHNS